MKNYALCLSDGVVCVSVCIISSPSAASEQRRKLTITPESPPSHRPRVRVVAVTSRFLSISEQRCRDECPPGTSVDISHLFFLFSLPCPPSLMMSLISNQGKREQMCASLINITFVECFLQKIKSASEPFRPPVASKLDFYSLCPFKTGWAPTEVCSVLLRLMCRT